MPAAPSSTLSTSSASIQCPVSSVRCPVRATSVHACLSTGPVSSVRCGRLSVQVSAVRRPLSGVRCLCVVASAVSGRSEVLERGVGRQPYGWDGRGRRGRPLRPCPARRLPESEPGARSWRRRCWASRASIWTWPSSWEVVGSGQLDRVADQDRPGAGEDRSLVGAGAQRARLLRQADRHAAGESLGRSCRVEPNIKKPIGHIPLAKQN